MLNLFPITFLAILAHALLRFIVGGIFIYLGYQHHKNTKATIPVRAIALLEIVIGTLFIIGLFTQAAALLGIMFSLCGLFLREKLATLSLPSPLFFLLLLGASLSLFITGAGALAFDLPI